ncbi:sugar transferase [Erythrobacter sp. WH131]|uniref:Sugar transferase n=2 Tax=Erythrobacter ani TaxID=2827235 RepID=A0ABS6SMP3_9SPHN|nr:sugar transferase [Erythrobacter ani]
MAPSLSDDDLISVSTDLASAVEVSPTPLKRTLDIVVALAMLVLLAPVMLLVALAVKLSSAGPILFRQERVGSQGRTFKCLKFRTMHVDAEIKLAQLLRAQPDLRLEWQCKQKLSVDPRITNIGNFLRQSSLDELPQLFNVLRGDMSLVGPRPIIKSEVPRYGRYITSYFRVKPGLSGLWQISGRNDASYSRRVAADVLYARSRTFAMDLKILVMTIPAVISGKGSC